MALIPTPYDNRINRLRDRVSQPGQQRRAQRKLQNFRARKYLYQQKHRPETPLPHSSAYETQVGGLRRDLQQSQSDIAGRRVALDQQYGFGADNSNPFSRANLLQRQFGQQRAATLNSYAGRGQLYSGALSRAQRSDRFGFEQDLDASLREYQGEMADLSGRELSAQRTFDEGVAAAEAQRLEAGLQDRPEPTESPATPNFVKAFLKRRRRRNKKNG